MIRILLPDSLRDRQHLSEMHQLRYQVFVKELKWEAGINGINQLEFDCYDHKKAFYLVHTDETDKVDAVVRLTPTKYPNVLMDTFQENMQFGVPERSDDVIEISRFCCDKTRAPKNIMGLVIASLLEIGIANEIRYYVSFSDTIIKHSSRRSGWDAQELGPVVEIENSKAVALRHDVSLSHYYEVTQKNHFEKSILAAEELERCPLNRLKMAL